MFYRYSTCSFIDLFCIYIGQSETRIACGGHVFCLIIIKWCIFAKNFWNIMASKFWPHNIWKMVGTIHNLLAYYIMQILKGTLRKQFIKFGWKINGPHTKNKIQFFFCRSFVFVIFVHLIWIHEIGKKSAPLKTSKHIAWCRKLSKNIFMFTVFCTSTSLSTLHYLK